MRRCLIVLPLSLLCTLSTLAQSASSHLRSPDGRVDLTFSLQHGVPFYEVSVSGKPALLASRLGLGPHGADGFEVASTDRNTHRETWKPAYGERDSMPDNYNQLTIALTQNKKASLKLELRAYDEGIAIRYGTSTAMQIDADLTEFHWPAHTVAFEEHGGTEGEYFRANISDIAPKCQTPLTLSLSDGSYAAILEAANTAFPLMTVSTKNGQADTLTAELGGPATLAAGMSTPWRVVMFARSPGKLLEHDYLQLDLNTPQMLRNTAWIKPGTAMRETSLTTEGAKKLIDFASSHGIPYIGFDDHWYGTEDVAHGDATHERTRDDNGKPTLPLSIADVAAYGKQHGIGLVIYVDRRQAYKQRDILFPLYEKWGVAGVKIGFVNVGTQQDTEWIAETIRKAAEHHLVLDIHDQYRATGYTRTYPNLLTVEGIRGNEHFPTSEHNTTIPFTRYLAGSADYTICYFDKRLKNTHAHQMAMSVITYSPMQWIFWYDNPNSFHNEPELPWFQNLPTVWNETQVPLGEIGKYAVLARRSGDRWYVGAITNSDQRMLSLRLSFLRPGITYDAVIYRDDPSVSTATHIGVEHRKLTREDVLSLTMSSNGGEAIYLQPGSKK